MLFSKKQPLLIYVTEASLRVYQGDEQRKTVELPTYKKGMRRILKSLFQKEIGALIEKQEVLIIVGGKLLYQKAFLLSEGTVGEEDKEAFFKDLPIEEDELARNVITTEHKIYLLGTNRTYYEAVLDVAATVVAVLPLSLFSDDTSVHELTREQRDDILNNSSLYEVGDFLSDNAYSPLTSDEDDNTSEELSPHEQIVVAESSFNPLGLIKLLGISLILGAIFFAGFVYWDKNMNSQRTTKSSEGMTPTPTVRVEENTIPKEELTVQILNGTGTPGQAGEVESLLTKAGFSNIEVGNAEEQDQQEAEIQVSNKVSSKVKEEVENALTDYFEDISFTTQTSDSTFDIRIITGVSGSQ